MHNTKYALSNLLGCVRDKKAVLLFKPWLVLQDTLSVPLCVCSEGTHLIYGFFVVFSFFFF